MTYAEMNQTPTDTLYAMMAANHEHHNATTNNEGHNAMSTNNENNGIDYGRGMTNIDKSNGIRYGVIPQNDVLQAWCDASESDYGDPHCPVCGNNAVDLCGESAKLVDDDGEDIDADTLEQYGHGCADYACPRCRHTLDGSDVFGDEPMGFNYDADGYTAECGDSGDIFITKSPYYTRAKFCSPCAPGAGYLRDATPNGVKTYCFGHDWFEDNQAPYPVFRVSDDAEMAMIDGKLVPIIK